MMASQGKKIWMDGKMLDFADATVHVLAHTLHYGVGVFEGIRAYPTPKGAAIFRLPEHVHRLVASARIYHIAVPYTEAEIARAIVETQAANGFTPSYIRPIIYRGEPSLGVKSQKGKVSLAIAAIPAGKYLGENSETGVRAKISPFRKAPSDSLPSYAKACGNYLGGYLAGVDAAQDGYEEAILLDHQGFVAEGTGENIFIVRNGRLYTPGTEQDILMGITRDSVMRLCEDLGYAVSEKAISVNELLTADEAFFVGTYAEVAPIQEVSHFPIGERCPGPISREVLEGFSRAARGEDPKYASWLTPVPPPVKAVARASRGAGA
jgi:branched-chain amino acid aminotransferase